ncbi:hypothetical protein OOZ19_19800 [Saccharopolyspora sp. NFXS83]|uniref:hypothetical protein n=1 Tax=Saccharopolyspora sp. NFXS83 TaxID=2993560 RepID=UPI00224AC2C7|nr:hypothetical protein [Saccharopolyspora sp. NFXS83]MCX2732489.1 hypothetical protein [Saccharopolyspora sp. NFXS83]
MLIRIPTPGDVLGMARSTVGWAVESATTVAAAPARVLGLVDGVEALLARVNTVVDGAEEILARTGRTVDEVEEVLREAKTVAAAAGATVEAAGAISAEARTIVENAGSVSDTASNTVADVQKTAAMADELLATYEPIARKAAPMAQLFVDELSQKEVDAAIRLVDELPVLTEHVLSDVLPILRTLDKVGPEIHELLEVTHDVRRAIVGIPGFQFFRRRGGEKVEEEADERSEPRPFEATRTDSGEIGSGLR